MKMNIYLLWWQNHANLFKYTVFVRLEEKTCFELFFPVISFNRKDEQKEKPEMLCIVLDKPDFTEYFE